MAKLPGKTVYSGVRRPMTRQSGFSAHPDSTGGEWKTEESVSINIMAGASLEIIFSIPAHTPQTWIAFGGWYCADSGLDINIDSPYPKCLISEPAAPNWSKFGSMWQGDGTAATITVLMTAIQNTTISFWNVDCGLVDQPGCHTAGSFEICTAPSYLTNLHLLSPEAHFWKAKGNTEISIIGSSDEPELNAGSLITLKSCNRCARFLPINVYNERIALSFSNHCVARRPCTHTGFGRLKHTHTNEILQLEYGYQLECRFCKKYCVNAAHNKERTGAQMKEDGARRRYLEFLISELYQGSCQILFKYSTGLELSDYVWNKFQRQCFNCKTMLPSVQSMHLDHTRPLALLWPLDESATALCGSCNSSKRDRFPNEFYTHEQLTELSILTGIPLIDLTSPSPNMDVISAIVERLDWLFETFLTRPEMTRVRDGKVTGELVVKALQKAFDAAPGGSPVNLIAEYERRRQCQT